MAINFTNDQENAIKATGTVLVSAAAGSGKTAVLTERVVRKIVDKNNGIDADRLLIVTFTNASALEMKTRIAENLDKYINENPKSPYLLKQRLLLQSAKICTIDSFCIDLVRRYFSVLGVSPDFNIADNSRANKIKNDCIDSVLSGYYSSKDDDFDILANTLNIAQSEDALRKIIIKIYERSMCMANSDKWFGDSLAFYDYNDVSECVFVKEILNKVTDKLDYSCEKLSLALREIIGSDLEGIYFESINSCLSSLKTVKSAAESGNWDTVYNLILNFSIFNISNKKTEYPNIKEVVKFAKESTKNSLESIKKLVYANKETINNDMLVAKRAVRKLIEIVKKFALLYFETLNASNILTFAIVEQLALKLLCDQKGENLVPSAISKEISAEFDEVLVDEYQDNNNLQDALFYAVSNSGKKLFMVGDVKQSIYGFRNANPENFLKYKNDFPLFDGVSKKSKVVLKANYRSRDGICDFVNAFCDSIMSVDTCGMDYLNEDALDSKALFDKTDSVVTEIHITDTKENDNKREICDARQIVDYIENLMKSEAFIKTENGLRKAEYKDFTILLRSPKSHAQYYLDVLEENNIPVSLYNDNFFLRPEILTIISILKVISNPLSDLALLSVMTSSVFSFTADEISRLRANSLNKSLYSCVVLAADKGDLHCQKLIDTFKKLRLFSATLPLNKLIGEIYKLTFLKEIMSAYSDGVLRLENLEMFTSLAIKYESYSDRGLQGFVSYLYNAVNNNEDIERSKEIDRDKNAVKIMSFHGSKGLQFPICIIADIGGEFNFTDLRDRIVLSDKFGVGMKYVDDDNVLNTTVARSAVELDLKKKLIAEEIRLFYVAMTRAEERLMLSISTENVAKKVETAAINLGLDAVNTGKIPAEAVLSANTPMSWIFMMSLLQKDGDKLGDYAGVNPIGFNGNGRFKLVVSSSNYDSAVADKNVTYDDLHDSNVPLVNNELLEQIKNRLEFNYPYADESQIPSKLAVTELLEKSQNSFTFARRPQFMSKLGLTPAERGTAAHKFMQFADYKNAENDVTAELDRLTEWEFLTPEEAEAISVNDLSKFFCSNIYSRIKVSKNVKREYKFMVEYPFENSKTIIQGIADCIFEEPDGIVILDFKTDNIKDISELKERYSKQLEIYKYALEQIMQKPVKECILYSLKLGQSINV